MNTDSGLADFFISRAGGHPADVSLSEQIAEILEEDGHTVILQQWDFNNRNFMERMNASLASGARVISIMSPEYLASDYCQAEWTHALHGDPLNKKERLIVLRSAECTPKDQLLNIAYWDLIPVQNDKDLLKQIVLHAITPNSQQSRSASMEQYWREMKQHVHEAIRSTPNFTGREEALEDIDAALWSDKGAAAITHSAAVTGLGGIGKSTLAKEYAARFKDKYAGIWWIEAEKSGTADAWPKLEQGLIDLGKLYDPTMAFTDNVTESAKRALEFISRENFDKPWLFILDNVDSERLLSEWPLKDNVKYLITTRLENWESHIDHIKINKWSEQESISYLLRETNRDDLTEDDARLIAKTLDNLPLALSHAAAYLRKMSTATAATYCAAIELHVQSPPPGGVTDVTVYATFKQQIEQAEAYGKGAQSIISLAAFYDPNHIPLELYSQPAEIYPEILSKAVADPVRFERALSALVQLSLIEFSPDTQTFSLHRLVQSAARDDLGDSSIDRAQYAGQAAYYAFPKIPEPTAEEWPAIDRLIPHVRSLSIRIPVEESNFNLAFLFGIAGSCQEHKSALNDVLPFHIAALKVYMHLAAEFPDNLKLRRELSVSHNKIGDVLVAQGNLSEALAAYKASLAIREHLADADPGHAEWQRDLSVSQEKIGDVLVAQGNLSDAFTAYKASLAIREHLADADPGHAGWQRDLSVSHNKIGNVLVAQGNLSEALAAYEASLAIAQHLADADPGHAGWQRDLSVSQDRIGNVLVAQGNLSEALAAYKASLAIAQHLADADPGHAGWQRDLSVSQEMIGDVLVAQGNLSDALTAYKASLAIREHLADADPGHAGWQRDLSVALNKIGNVLVAHGNLSEALAAYKASLAIAQHLADADPGHAGWQRDLSVSQEKIGDVLVAQGNLFEALAAYKASLAIAQHLADADPGHAGWQRDLSVSQEKIGDVLVAQGNLSDALTAYKASLAIREHLADADPGHAGWQRDLSVSHNKIGDVLVAQGNLSEALAAYKASLAIREHLADADPGYAGWQRDLSVSQEKIGDVLVAQGNLSEALAAYKASLAIREHLADADPGHAGWQRDLAISLGNVGKVQVQLGEKEQAKDMLAKGRAIIERLIEISPDQVVLKDDLASFDNLLSQTIEQKPRGLFSRWFGRWA